jgi:membrane protein
LRRTGLGDLGGTLVSLLFWPVLAVVMVAGLSALYRLAPARTPMLRGWWTWGGVVGTAIFFVGSIAFVIYANVAGGQSAAYGIFSSILLLMLWLMIAANAVLIGAEVNAELEKQGRW